MRALGPLPGRSGGSWSSRSARNPELRAAYRLYQGFRAFYAIATPENAPRTASANFARFRERVLVRCD